MKETEVFFGPTSVTMASLSERLVQCKRQIVCLPDPMIEYNSMYFANSELSAFMSTWDEELIGGLTQLYDVEEYSRDRVTRDIHIKLERPQLSALIGGTPANIMKLIPDFGWEQGYTSRMIMVFSDEKPVIDTFNTPAKTKPPEMIHDLKVISALHGQMGWTEEYAKAMHNWKLLGFTPTPGHPKLASYCARRFSHLIKLSMVASIDRGNDLTLTVADFNRSMGWLLEAEVLMPEIFRIGSTSSDAKAIDDIAHFVSKRGRVPEHLLIRYVQERVPAYAVLNVIGIMERSGQIKAVSVDPKTGLRVFIAT